MKKGIINILREFYNIGTVKKINKIKRGSSQIYKIIAEDSYILKIHQEKYNIDDLSKEISITNYLNNKGFKTSEYIMSYDDEYFVKKNNQFITLQKYIEGYTVESNKGSYEQVIESASYLGKLVLALKDYPYKLPGNKITWTNINKINNSIKVFQLYEKKLGYDKVALKIKRDLVDKAELLNKIKSKIDNEDIDKISYLNTHGDYSVMQFIYQKNKIKAIIDFESAAYQPIIWEIIRSYTYIDKDCSNGKINVNHFLEYVLEFNKFYKLNEYD